MELKEFIESGLIESYLLGTASTDEVRLVNSMILKYPELKKEFDSIEQTLLKVAESNAPNPGDYTKQKILSEINQQQKPLDNNIVPIQKNKPNKLFRYGMAASVALLLVSIAVNLMMVNQNIGMQNKLSKLNKENTYMQAEFKTLQNDLNKIKSEYALLTDRNNKTIMLKGLDLAPNAMVTVYWNQPTSRLHLLINDLPPPPEGKQYQLWAMVDGVPVDAGVFNYTEGSDIHSMKNIQNAQAFAVTLENKGGSPIPTLEAMYVMGEV